MKFSGKAQDPLTFSGKLLLKRQNASPDSDLHARKNTPRATVRRRPRTPVTRLTKNGAPVGRRSRPETPLLNWKIHDRGKNEIQPLGFGEDDDKPVQECGRRPSSKNGKKGREVVVSARKLAAVLWRMQLPEVGVAGEGRPSILQRNEDRLGLQHGVHNVNIPLHLRLNSLDYGSDLKNISQSPQSFYGTKDGLFSKNMMEGATKWDPISLKTSEEANQIYSQMKLADQKISIVSVVSGLEVELEQALIRIQELETERKSSKKKLEHFLRKVNEERASWRSREHEKIRAYIDDMRAELNRERKSRQRLEIVNTRLVNELADAKLLGKRYLQDYEKEREARELLEEVCDELAKEIGEDKAEIEASKRESISFKEEVEEERRMLQMAEVWREERVQMKLVDAKVALEEKYSQMNKLVKDLENFLKTLNENPNAGMKEKREAEILRQTAASVNIQDMQGFRYEPSNPDDIFSIFEDPNFGEPNEKEIEPCVSYTSASHASKIHTSSPEANLIGKDIIQRHSNAFVDENGDVEDESGWETVSQLEDQGSSYSPDGSAPSVNKNCLDCNVSRTGSPLDWDDNTGEETPITEISEVISVPKKQLKKVSSIARLWRRSCPKDGENYKIISVDAMNGRLSNGRLSNGAILSPDRGSGKGGYSPRDLIGHWNSPESRNRGMKGCIPHGAQNNSLKSKLSEARMDSQKVQLRHVLKQKI